jgi:aspartate racemase
MKNKQIAIGILGGIGPEATGNFYLKLISELQKQNLIRSNADYPRIVINSIPAPELTSAKITVEQLEPYIQGVKQLEKYGANFIVMACNTIHLYYDLLQSKVKIPILDLREAVKIALSNSKTVSIFGTPATIEKGLYNFKGIKYFNPEGGDLKHLSEAIEKFNTGYQRTKQITVINKLAHKYIQKGSKVIILACTEISLMLEKTDIPRKDTLDILTEYTVNYLKTLKSGV